MVIIITVLLTFWASTIFWTIIYAGNHQSKEDGAAAITATTIILVFVALVIAVIWLILKLNANNIPLI